MNMRPIFSILCLSISLKSFAADPPTQATKTSPAAKEQQTTKPSSKETDKKAPGVADRLTLDTTAVTGNRELPKVLYIVPWKRADLGNLPEQSFGSLLDDTLAPVDREVFRREVDYYQALTDKSQSAKTGDGKP